MTTIEPTSTEGSPSPGRRDGLATRAGHAFALFRGGDTRGMDILVDLLTPILWHTARSQGVGIEAARDVVQTAWLRLVEQADRIEEHQAVLGWLVVTVRRESWRVARSGRRDDQGIPDDTVEGSPGPEERTLETLERTHLWNHVRALDPRCQALLRVIAFAERPDYALISEALGMPIGSIGPTRGRCLSKLRLALQDDPAWGATT